MRIRQICSLFIFWLIFDLRRNGQQRNSSVTEVIMAELRAEVERRHRQRINRKWKPRPEYINRQLKYRSTQAVSHRYTDHRMIRRRCIND